MRLFLLLSLLAQPSVWSSRDAASLARALDEGVPNQEVLCGAGLAELKPCPYGPTAEKALMATAAALPGDRPNLVTQAVLESARDTPLAAKLVAALSAPHEQQLAKVASACGFELAGRRPPLEQVVLACELERRAKEGGFAQEPLHQRCVAVMLGVTHEKPRPPAGTFIR